MSVFVLMNGNYRQSNAPATSGIRYVLLRWWWAHHWWWNTSSVFFTETRDSSLPPHFKARLVALELFLFVVRKTFLKRRLVKSCFFFIWTSELVFFVNWRRFYEDSRPTRLLQSHITRRVVTRKNYIHQTKTLLDIWLCRKFSITALSGQCVIL